RYVAKQGDSGKISRQRIFEILQIVRGLYVCRIPVEVMKEVDCRIVRLDPLDYQHVFSKRREPFDYGIQTSEYGRTGKNPMDQSQCENHISRSVPLGQVGVSGFELFKSELCASALDHVQILLVQIDGNRFSRSILQSPE